nr:hypothetical protein [Calliblepharis sp.]
MLTYYTLQYYCFQANQANLVSSSIIHEYNFNKKNNYIAMIKTSDTYQQFLKIKNYDEAYENIKNFANKKLVSRNFIIKLLNTYWQETIFISSPNSLSNIYTDQLKSDGLAIYKNQYKKFLLDFSKALAASRIEVCLSDNNTKYTNNSYLNNEIKYIWKKGLNCLWPNHLLSFLLKYYKFIKLNNKKLKLFHKLQFNYLPLFTVVNNSYQMIIAEPSDELIYNKSIIDKIYQWYYHSLFTETNNQPLYEGLFFINPQDALEYKQYIQYKHTTVSIKHNLNLLTCNLSFYYQLFYKSPLKIQFHLIPDLKELGKLIYKYQYNHNISFHKKQIYNKYSFQGQPIYLIKPLMTKNKKNKKIEIVRYNYSMNKKVQNKPHEFIFLNYDIVLLAWQKFIEENIEYKLPKKPPVLVYNLEDFLNKYNDQNKQHSYMNNIIFIPSEESYNCLKSNLSLKLQKNLQENCLHYIDIVKMLIYRIIWSLTSKQPVNL